MPTKEEFLKMGYEFDPVSMKWKSPDEKDSEMQDYYQKNPVNPEITKLTEDYKQDYPANDPAQAMNLSPSQFPSAQQQALGQVEDSYKGLNSDQIKAKQDALRKLKGF